MASLLANMRLARRLTPRNPRRCAASCVSARLRPQAAPPLGGTTQWGGSKLPPQRSAFGASSFFADGAEKKKKVGFRKAFGDFFEKVICTQVLQGFFEKRLLFRWFYKAF